MRLKKSEPAPSSVVVVYGPKCQQCGKPAEITAGQIALCMEDYAIYVARWHRAADGLQWDEHQKIFRPPTPEEREVKLKARAAYFRAKSGSESTVGKNTLRDLRKQGLSKAANYLPQSK